ncbi:MAG: transcriptional regulator with XRE-family HTH domain [Crocinitomix sp.]|jgi:transcriptional regulator with XRE-family HTH domain
MDITKQAQQNIVALGQLIKKIRKERSMTQKDVAGKMYIDIPSYQRIERGDTNPTYKTLFLVSKALDIHISELFMDQSK